MNQPVNSTNVISCPDCQKKNRFSTQYELNCGHCGCTIARYETKMEKKTNLLTVMLLTASVGVVGGGGGAFAYQEYKEEFNRYGVKTELGLVQVCASTFKGVTLTEDQQSKVWDGCICALRQTQYEFPLLRYKHLVNAKEFKQEFNNVFAPTKSDTSSLPI